MFIPPPSKEQDNSFSIEKKRELIVDVKPHGNLKHIMSKKKKTYPNASLLFRDISREGRRSSVRVFSDELFVVRLARPDDFLACL